MSDPQKIVLKKKGDEAFVALKQLIVNLKWSTDVDLDLMAFYETKDGIKGGVYSNLYPGGSLGSLNAFPFIELSGDEGVGEAGGDNAESIRITKLDDMKQIYIVTINYTDASQKREVYFDSYDGVITVIDDKGASIEVSLNSSDRGHVAVIAKIDNTNPMGPKLINMNDVMDLPDFVGTVPGAESIVNR